MQQIVIPWRNAGCGYRLRSFNFLCDYYSKKYEIVIGDKSDIHGNFSRSGSRNDGVSKTDGEIVVVIDSDNYIDISQIEKAIDAASNNNVLIKPNSKFGYVSEESTQNFYNGKKVSLDLVEFQSPPASFFHGGAYVIKRSLWDFVGGMDEEFIGYGGEDDAFHISCESKLGKTIWIKGYDYHLYHPANRVTPKENYNRLMEFYPER
jgi:glycosyltransferase involved in cell wall biosynthesis